MAGRANERPHRPCVTGQRFQAGQRLHIPHSHLPMHTPEHFRHGLKRHLQYAKVMNCMLLEPAVLCSEQVRGTAYGKPDLLAQQDACCS